MLNILLILLGKLLSKISKTLNLGAGSTWPGHIALKVNKHFIKQTIVDKTKVVLVAGTNGKTTTSTLITKILSEAGFNVSHNKSGSNQLNGIASAIISGIKPLSSKIDSEYLVIEVDENVLPLALKELTSNYIICLNLFRDQLDRYGEIDSIVKKWKSCFESLSKQTTLVLNADDPQISFLGDKLRSKVLYFGLNEKIQKEIEHGADSTYCPNCLHDLNYESVTFSHLGDWKCLNCGLKRPTPSLSSLKFYPLLGTYNKYNSLAAVLFARTQKIAEQSINNALKDFKPAFGRQEEFEVDGKRVKIFLSKNPTSFNQSLLTTSDLNAKNLLIVLNDRYVDGIDVSWIWDVNFEKLLNKSMNIFLSGNRVYDLALRLHYSSILKNLRIDEDLSQCINTSLRQTSIGQTLYILPTYSAMLDVRKILKGRKIL